MDWSAAITQLKSLPEMKALLGLRFHVYSAPPYADEAVVAGQKLANSSLTSARKAFVTALC
jgi:hypothetical protein